MTKFALTDAQVKKIKIQITKIAHIKNK